LNQTSHHAPHNNVDTSSSDPNETVGISADAWGIDEDFQARHSVVPNKQLQHAADDPRHNAVGTDPQVVDTEQGHAPRLVAAETQEEEAGAWADDEW
jgi:hypothetical protein